MFTFAISFFQGFLKQERQRQKVFAHSLGTLMTTQGSIVFFFKNSDVSSDTENFSDSNSFFTDWKLGRNAVHGSDSYEAAGREIDLLFPTITGIVVLYLINISLFIGDADGINFGSGLEDAVKEVGEEQKTYLARWQKYKEG